MADRSSTEGQGSGVRGQGVLIPDSCRLIVREARSWLGTPYHHQASIKGVGCDCLGLVRGVWRALVGPEPEALPGYSADWGEAHGHETLLAAARRHLVELWPGDMTDVLARRPPTFAKRRRRVGGRTHGPSGQARGRQSQLGPHLLPGDVLVFRMRDGRVAKHAGILAGLLRRCAPRNDGRGDGLSLDECHRHCEPAAFAEGRRARADAGGGAATFIHAQEGGPVCEVALSPWWAARIVAAFRFPDPTPSLRAEGEAIQPPRTVWIASSASPPRNDVGAS